MTAVEKGIGFIPHTDCADLARLNGSWYYNWWYETECEVEATTFIPMVWSHRQLSDEVFETVRRQRPSAVLTFNEPSLETQAALPLLDSQDNIDEVLRYWRRLEEAFRPAGIPIGSPAPAPEVEDQAWARQFFLELKARDLRPDFIALHFYCRESHEAPGAEAYYTFLGEWRDWLDGTLGWQLPIWVTEYGCIDLSLDANRRFMEATFDLMLGRGKYGELHVERYCWFANRTFHPVFHNSALVDEAGELTRIGALYRAATASHMA
jgi:hypothetical protein